MRALPTSCGTWEAAWGGRSYRRHCRPHSQFSFSEVLNVSPAATSWNELPESRACRQRMRMKIWGPRHVVPLGREEKYFPDMSPARKGDGYLQTTPCPFPSTRRSLLAWMLSHQHLQLYSLQRSKWWLRSPLHPVPPG